MKARFSLAIGALAFAVLLGACSDSSSVTSPASQRVAGTPSFQGGSSTDTSAASGGGGGGGGGGSAATPCGNLSTAISTYNIVVYTTRIGIGVSGTAYNCG